MLEPREPCDCGIMTVLRQDGVPTCHRCQQHKRKMQQTWLGQEPVAFKMDEVVKSAVQLMATYPDRSHWTPRQIVESFQHDTALKRAMETMRYDEWRRLHPHKTKEELINGLE